MLGPMILLLVHSNKASALVIRLEGGRNFCFYEVVERENGAHLLQNAKRLPETSELELEYLSVDRAVHAEVYEPNGRSLFRDELSREKRIRLPARKEGLYKVCFFNERYAESLTTIFSVRKVVEPQEEEEGPKGASRGESSGDGHSTRLVEGGKSLLRAVRRLKGQLLSLQEKQRYLLAREMLHGQSNE